MSGDLAALRDLKGKRFWRALDELVQRPEIRARIAEAFPALAGSAADWRRRDILKCLGGALAIAGLDGCERVPDEEALPFVEQPEGQEPGIARFYATAVEFDGVAQPVVGRTREGRPVKLEGNPDHPACRGASDPFTQAALLGLYDPERSAAPRRRGDVTDWAHYDAEVTALRAKLDASGGAGFRLLTGRVGSPTLLTQIGALLQRWPAARWHMLDPLPRRAAGEQLRLERAEVIVALDDDLLGPGPNQVFHARGWGARRQAYQAGNGSALLFVAEPSPTLTGVTASDRLVAGRARVPVLLAALAAKVSGGAAPALNTREADWVEAAGDALLRHRGRGLVSVGTEHAELHAGALAIDAALGNTVRRFVSVASGPAPADFASLSRDLAAGAVETLISLEANPAYTAPGFAPLYGRVPLTIHAGVQLDETAKLSQWHLPLAHGLESWSDARAADGSAILIQPLVRPWLGVRSRHALMAGLLDDGREDRAIVRATWPQLDDAGWQQALLAGSITDSAPSEAPAPPSAAGAARPREGLDLIVRPDPTVWDGSLAPNPWLQELPKPLTKITWGNAVHLSPALARERGLENGDRVRVRAGSAAVDGPVWILPGQERNTILVHLGHGRTGGGRVAEGIGFDAWPLLDARGPVSIDRLDGREKIATTQHHFAMKDEEFVRFVDKAGDALPKEPPKPNFYPRLPKSNPAWGMAIDLDLCIGCNACVSACVAENNIAMVGKDQVLEGREMHWIRVDRYYEGDPDDPAHVFQPVPCMHCEDAPCEMGCPVNAAVHSPDGLNLQVYNRCIGTRTCSAYCPYKVRRFNWFDLTKDDPPSVRAARNPEVTVRGRGVMEKCTYCIQRISAARITAKKEDRAIREGEVVTACQAACPTDAIVFGNIADERSAVSRRKASPRDYDLLEEANTRPRTTYGARIRRGADEA